MSRPAVLVVDDDPDFAASLGDLISDEGCDVAYALYGMDALAQYDLHTFDLVFMDSKMPGMGGAECFFNLRKRHPDAQVVMVTGHYRDYEILKLKNNGLRGVLEKPVNIDNLKRELENIKSLPVILVAEYDSDCMQAVSWMLSERGYRVSKASNGREAVDKVKQGNIGLLILNPGLPVMDGQKVCEELRKADCLPPTILLTRYPDSLQVSTAKSACRLTTEAIIKPVKPEQLYKAMDYVLHTSGGRAMHE